ncbi:carbonic anhydrase family protein [Enterococcus termitis]|uniref:carbonic anhydrase n=1 Tax=Enterococcus termitis TaxID=332950 RepID=A0A1E5G6Q7_9ENTE|nr:carbonic anhydrase family protein [Enterococcus termitis]OEG08404.1 carbonic anhydrase [Enterococcus termitis]OJG98024.1 carbonic anhydrase [Enterococcus termitis]
MKNIRNMDVEWGYTGETGPEHWHTLCDWFSLGAKYPYQSPVNLTKTLISENTADREITFFYKNEEFTEKEFKNTFHFVPPNTESYVVFEGEKYYLTDIHFHTPSEHTFEGEHCPLEFHLVHMNNSGENLVVGCLFILTKEINKFSKDQAAFIWQTETHQQWFNPAIFLPEQRSHFHYLGSLTTPPTKGPVHWFVFDTVQQMDHDFFQRIDEGMLPFNNRPVQPLNGRKIYFSE